MTPPQLLARAGQNKPEEPPPMDGLPVLETDWMHPIYTGRFPIVDDGEVKTAPILRDIERLKREMDIAKPQEPRRYLVGYTPDGTPIIWGEKEYAEQERREMDRMLTSSDASPRFFCDGSSMMEGQWVSVLPDASNPPAIAADGAGKEGA